MVLPRTLKGATRALCGVMSTLLILLLINIATALTASLSLCIIFLSQVLANKSGYVKYIPHD